MFLPWSWDLMKHIIATYEHSRIVTGQEMVKQNTFFKVIKKSGNVTCNLHYGKLTF